MDNGFKEAVSAYWDKRIDALAVPSRALDVELEQTLARLMKTFSDEQIDVYLAVEDIMNRRDASVKEFFYKTGFEDAVRFLYGILKEKDC